MSLPFDNRASLSGVLPWTRSCFVCGESNPNGLRLRSRVENGQVLLTYTARDTDLGYRHLVHGGIVMTLLDEVMTWAAILHFRRACVAAEMTCRLKKPMEVGCELHVVGEVAEANPKLILTRGVIRNHEGTEFASASGKYMPMASGQLHLCVEDFVVSPDALNPADLLGHTNPPT